MVHTDEYVTSLHDEINYFKLEVTELRKLKVVVEKMHAQLGPDRCVFDQDELYAAAGLPPVDKRVGDKFAMLKDCIRYVDVMCEGGHWKTYADLEEENKRLRESVERLVGTGYCPHCGAIITNGK